MSSLVFASAINSVSVWVFRCFKLAPKPAYKGIALLEYITLSRIDIFLANQQGIRVLLQHMDQYSIVGLHQFVKDYFV